MTAFWRFWGGEAAIASRAFAFALAMAAAVLISAVSPVEAGDPEIGIDRPGSDYQAPITLEPKQGSFMTYEMECQSLCKSDDKCMAWTMVKPGVQGPKAKCYLKSTVPAAKSNACCSSGVADRAAPKPTAPGEPEVGMDRPGSDYQPPIDLAPKQGSFLTYEMECKGLCTNDQRCKAWTVVKPGVQGPKAKCYLKDAVPAAKQNGCCSSGVAVREAPAISQEASDRDPRGKNIEQCGAAKQRNDVRCMQRGPVAGISCQAEVAQIFGACQGLASQAEAAAKAVADDRLPTGKNLEQCGAAFQRNQARCLQMGGGVASQLCTAEISQIFNACQGLAAQSKPGTIDNSGGGAPTPRPTPAPAPAAGGVPAEWADMLQAHNDTRKKHCTAPLEWSAQLANAAQDWANKCTNEHGSPGENLAFWRPTATNAQAYQNTWACEVDHYDFDNPKVVGGFKKGCDAPVNGHFTQIVWKDSTQLGCGKQTCTINGQTGVYFVCRYAPQGNFNADNIGNLTAQVSPPKC